MLSISTYLLAQWDAAMIVSILICAFRGLGDRTFVGVWGRMDGVKSKRSERLKGCKEFK